MFKRIVEKLIGWKLPCGHIRVRAKVGVNVTCPVCGNGYFRARFVCNKPRRAGMLVYDEDY
ncbi:MAG: hypothetical protein KAS32_22125 [Candidatus Peribacteraceae bacterium]|nr:hypothetical protein [Candidatus Peribacteraceae bacterium]